MTDATKLTPDQRELEQLGEAIYGTHMWVPRFCEDYGVGERTPYNWIKPGGLVPAWTLVALRDRLAVRNFAKAQAHLAELIRLMT